MKVEDLAVIQAQRLGPFQLRLSFETAYCMTELQRGEDAATVAMNLRELAAQIEARSK